MTDQPPTDPRDRIAEALYAHDHPGHLVPLNETGMGPAYRESADAVLAVLPPVVDRVAVYREVADRLAADAETGAKEGFTRIYRRSAAKQVREWAEELPAGPASQPPADRPAVLREAAEVADRIAVAMGKAEEDWASRARWACASIGAELRRMARLDEHPPETELAQRIAAKRSEGAFVEAAALSSSAGPLLAAEVQQQPDTETRLAAATCSAQYHGDDGGARLCIRAAQHTGKAHTDELGFHWSDTVAIYPLADGTFRTGINLRAALAAVPAEQPAAADGGEEADVIRLDEDGRDVETGHLPGCASQSYPDPGICYCEEADRG